MRKKSLISVCVIALALLVILLSLFLRIDVSEKKDHVRVAIVIDDWGYNLNNIGLLNSIEAPLTLAILPNLAFSGKIASMEYQRKNRELMLHMPMEPENDSLRLEEDTILCSMDKDKVVSLVTSALNSVPYVKGVSNHMGSKVTRDKDTVGAVMNYLQSRGMFFLDSVAVSDSICEQVAKDKGLAFSKRDVFLDNIADKKYIATQFDQLIATALEKGSAVGIGHDKSLTLETIKEKTLELKDSDIEFVLISELVSKVNSE